MYKHLNDIRVLNRGLRQRVDELPAMKLLSNGKLNDGEKPRIVLLDDDMLYLEMAKSWAYKFDIILLVISDVEQLLDILEKTRVDVLIVDQFLEDEQGINVAETFRDLPSILVSGTPSRIEWRPLASNIKAIVHKKFGLPTILNTAVTAAIESAESRGENQPDAA